MLRRGSKQKCFKTKIFSLFTIYHLLRATTSMPENWMKRNHWKEDPIERVLLELNLLSDLLISSVNTQPIGIE